LGALPDRAQTQINQLPADRLDALNEAFVEFTTLEDLGKWLDQTGADRG
jgi:hypothetical protein